MFLFDKTNIGKLNVKNHFIRAATYEGEQSADIDGCPTERLSDIYEQLAKGDVGTIITSFAYITNYEQPRKNQLGIYSNELAWKYRKIISKVHTYGTKIILQIVHGSSWGQGYPEIATILGPSAIKHPISGIIPKAMSFQEITNVTLAFAKAAQRAKLVGFDGVEIHCAHGYLLSQFISPLFNRRTDIYGGSVQNRFRFVKEVYAAIRKEVGVNFPVWIKMDSSENEPGGLSVDDFIYMSQELARDGIDAVEVSGNSWRFKKADERLYYKEAAERLANVVNIPVILTGGIRSMRDIKQVCYHSKVEFFGLARPFISNPCYVSALKKQVED